MFDITVYNYCIVWFLQMSEENSTTWSPPADAEPDGEASVLEIILPPLVLFVFVGGGKTTI